MLALDAGSAGDDEVAEDVVGREEPEIAAVQELPPCLEADPQEVSFGGVVPDDAVTVQILVRNCGNTPLKLQRIALTADSSPWFDIDSSGLELVPSPSYPLPLAAGEELMIPVSYAPLELSSLDADGSIVLDEGAVEVATDEPEATVDVSLKGACVSATPPTATIKSAEGYEVIPQTVLHLYGDESYAPDGIVAVYKWEVDQPPLSQSVFVPSSTFPNPTFEVNVAGIYTFRLTVFDAMGAPSPFPATFEVVVIPDEAIHIELLWHTPDDPDETDTGPEAGSDLDLHFLHPFAAGPDLDGDGAPDGWFDIPFDCFWFNAHPNFGSYDPAINDDPGLDQDDTDGAGPENINLDIPENVTYRVGVHYWNDHGYGSAWATVRVYIYGQLVLAVENVLLKDLDMWEVATVEWPSAKVEIVTEDSPKYKITHDYKNQFFFP